MKILVFDRCFSATGHRVPYAGLVAKAFADHEVIVALPRQVEGEPILNDYFSDKVRFHFFETEPKSGTFTDVQ